MTNVVTAVIAGLITAFVAALVLDGPALDPEVIIFGIAGAMIGYLVPKSSGRAR